MEKYTNTQKAAILLLSVGPDASAGIMKHLDEKEIEIITKEITSLRKVTSNVKNDIMKEFHKLAVDANLVSYGGIDIARDLLKRTFGPDKAAGFLKRMDNGSADKPFKFIQQVEQIQIFNLLQYENAQTIALVLSYLDSEKAAATLAAFPPEQQIEIAMKIAMMDTASPIIVQQVEQVLEEKLTMTSSQSHDAQSGIDSIVSILSSVDRGTEKNILDTLQEEEPELANEIKQRMFVFDDIAYLDNRSIQRILMDVQNQDLPLALRTASQGVKDVIFRNISKRREESLQEEMSSTEPVRLKDVEDAQGRIVSIVRKLEEEGSIIISRNGAKDLVI
ncbi:flagellar motor switch protein FliG [Neobacillus notoginsengisoli]|uniref:Flagellar motor switch protein FliG n=1 Tax=Neobacillus notoginsengisoli TaxID=1578198 RepID=A0A417YJR2_9BACI|nr:flagellar motor switch protein FliG [Neobacillus notoginsengisoli]RHW33308.1 flagellar motor switch protein FliG [Neobacillus notoginsengisoli]